MSDLLNPVGMQVVIHGNPINGFETTGPFKLPSDAINWATEWCTTDWYLSPLQEPTDGEGNHYP